MSFDKKSAFGKEADFQAIYENLRVGKVVQLNDDPPPPQVKQAKQVLAGADLDALSSALHDIESLLKRGDMKNALRLIQDAQDTLQRFTS